MTSFIDREVSIFSSQRNRFLILVLLEDLFVVRCKFTLRRRWSTIMTGTECEDLASNWPMFSSPFSTIVMCCELSINLFAIFLGFPYPSLTACIFIDTKVNEITWISPWHFYWRICSASLSITLFQLRKSPRWDHYHHHLKQFIFSPPWYIELYGFDMNMQAPGYPAGFLNFDQITGIKLFTAMYSKNANVFAAIPSLHAAYPLITVLYGSLSKKLWLHIAFVFFTLSVWFSAVYSRHHYVLDVLAGGTCAVTAYLLYRLLSRVPTINRLLTAYSKVI